MPKFDVDQSRQEIRALCDALGTHLHGDFEAQAILTDIELVVDTLHFNYEHLELTGGSGVDPEAEERGGWEPLSRLDREE